MLRKLLSVLVAVCLFGAAMPMSSFAIWPFDWIWGGTFMVLDEGQNQLQAEEKYPGEPKIVTIANGGKYIAGGYTKDTRIEVTANEPVTIMFSNLHIDISGAKDTNINGPAFLVQGNANVTIILDDKTVNTLKSPAMYAGLQKNNADTKELTIKGNGTLNAFGGQSGAGIGGGYERTIETMNPKRVYKSAGANIIIESGTINATGGNCAAGIGGGRNGNAINIHINGGTITATGGIEGGAGVGGGYLKGSQWLFITGGTVNATGKNGGSGIGGGYKGTSDTISISGGVVTAKSVGQFLAGLQGEQKIRNSGAGVGAGGTSERQELNGLNTVIYGGTVTAIGERAFRDSPNMTDYQNAMSFKVSVAPVMDNPNLFEPTHVSGATYTSYKYVKIQPEANPTQNFVSANGTTSVRINANEATSLIEKYGADDANESTYTITNPKKTNGEPVFEIGSRFWVRWLDPTENSDEWLEYYLQLDAKIQNSIAPPGNNPALQIFLMGVTKPDGTEYKGLDKYITVTVKFKGALDIRHAKYQAVLIRPIHDATINLNLAEENYNYDGYALITMQINHFSPYAIYEVAQNNNENKNTYPTGDNSSFMEINASISLMVASLGVIFVLKKKCNL